MSNIIPFDSGNLPSHFKSGGAVSVNSDLTAHAGGGFPVISIKGKVFAIVRDGERSVLTNPKDPDSPATSIEVVIVKANKGLSKVYYAKGYQDGAEATKPDCFSNEGVKPDPSVEEPQSRTCAICPNNQWGSKIGDNGGKGKACQDSKRLAIAQPDMLNDPYLIRVPPASIKPLSEYAVALGKRGAEYNQVLTKISFDMEVATPKLIFKPVGLLSDATYNEVKDAIDSEVVQNILGAKPTELPMLENLEPKAEPKPAPVAEKPAVKAKAKVEPKAEPKPEPIVEAGDLNLDDLNFDD